MMYLLPVVLIIGIFGYSFWYMQQNKKLIAEGHGPQMFHDVYAGAFSSLQPGEMIASIWLGTQFIPSDGAAKDLAGAAVNAASSALIGLSKYVPSVTIARTSMNRLMFAREHSQHGQRGHFSEVACYPPGSSAQLGASIIQSVGSAPANPHNPMKSYELLRISAADGQYQDVWLMNESLSVDGQVRRIEVALQAPPAQPVIPPQS